jgi:hypothetical protein
MGQNLLNKFKKHCENIASHNNIKLLTHEKYVKIL